MSLSSSTRSVSSSPGKLRQFLRHHPLVCYFLLAYGFSWVAWLPYVLSRNGLGVLPVNLSEFAAIPGLYLGPLLSGFLMTAATDGKTGVQNLLRRIVLWRVGWQWYLFALVGIPVFLFLGYFVLPGSLAVLHSPFPQIFLVYPLWLLLEIFTSALGEEPGWRGFALPRLQTRYGALVGTLILGILWGCWHLPLFLTSWAGGSVNWLDVGGFLLKAIGTAIMITWMFNHTRGSLFMTILLHASIDAFGTVMVVLNIFQVQWIQQNTSLAQLLALGVVPLLLILVTRGRLGYQRTSSSSDEASLLNSQS